MSRQRRARKHGDYVNTFTLRPAGERRATVDDLALAAAAALRDHARNAKAANAMLRLAAPPSPATPPKPRASAHAEKAMVEKLREERRGRPCPGCGQPMIPNDEFHKRFTRRHDRFDLGPYDRAFFEAHTHGAGSTGGKLMRRNLAAFHGLSKRATYRLQEQATR